MSARRQRRAAVDCQRASRGVAPGRGLAIARPCCALAAACWLAVAAPAAADTPDGGANISVQVEPSGDTTLEVRRGQVAVKANGSQTRVHAGETVRVPSGQPLHRLLPPAAPLAPADGATVNALDVALAWQPVAGAVRYILELSSDPEFHPVRAETIAATRTKLHLDAATTWYWRVVALDKDGHPGRRGSARRLTIDVTPPKLKAGKPEWH
jgi:hypothetical protein